MDFDSDGMEKIILDVVGSSPGITAKDIKKIIDRTVFCCSIEKLREALKSMRDRKLLKLGRPPGEKDFNRMTYHYFLTNIERMEVDDLIKKYHEILESGRDPWEAEVEALWGRFIVQNPRPTKTQLEAIGGREAHRSWLRRVAMIALRDAEWG